MAVAAQSPSSGHGSRCLPMSHFEPKFGAADLSNCDREPIHIPGSIQPHGALVALDRDTLRAVQAGGNTRELIGLEPLELVGLPIEDWLSPDQITRLRDMLAIEGSMLRPIHAFRGLAEPGKGKTDVTAHVSDGFLILEFEPIVEEGHDETLTLVQTMVRKIQQAELVELCCQMVAEVVRSASRFDRVMVYRFLPDGSGAVEAEARDPGLEPFLGLRYPASDIPKQARELYLRNWICLIADVESQPSVLQPPLPAAHGQALDLSHSALRAVSPIHIEYLRNMGVAATMSMSLVLEGHLWGLIACHSTTRRYVPHRLRVVLELFSQMASFLLETKITAEELLVRTRPNAVTAEILNELSGNIAPNEKLQDLRPKLLELIEADGLGLWLDGRYSRLGLAPEAEDVEGLVRWLNETASSGVFHTDSLPLLYKPASDFADVASGILALSVSKAPRDYVIWFRQELIETVTWAGDPDKAVAREADTIRLSPRKSFAAWRQQVKLHSKPWSSFSLQCAQTLRVALLEIVLRHVDQLARERGAARARQDVLLEALDERIRQWEATARDLKNELDRRMVVEAELSQVLRSTVVNQEAERLRIARELHDSLGQYLSIMQLNLDGLGNDVEGDPRIKGRVAHLKQLTADVGQEVNRLAWEIRPTSLDDLGLQTAIQQFLEEWSQSSGLQVDQHLTLGERRLPTIIETSLYRILQEAMTNVVKHAKARRVGVILKATAKEAILIVEDDGQGFQLEESKIEGMVSSRLGLLGMRERLYLVGGALEIETLPGRGTTIIVHVPLG